MKGAIKLIFIILLISSASAFVIDHNYANFNSINQSNIETAKQNLHITYAHTSHGSQLIDGMTAVEAYYGTDYAFGPNNNHLSLNLNDYYDGYNGCTDLSTCDADSNSDGYADWYESTVQYLADNTETNVVMWSWCSINGHNAQLYLDTMEKLIADYPEVTFIFMTGHAEGQGEDLIPNRVHYNNELIRNHVASHNRILYDFADIESYDPNGNYFWDKNMQDDLDYTGGNWADEWIANNPQHQLINIASEVPSCAHSRDLNCALKGLATWSLWTSIASGVTPPNEDGGVYPDCSEDWSCAEWGECYPEGRSNLQSRFCTDANLCGSQNYKPVESRTCIPGTGTSEDSTSNETVNDTTPYTDIGCVEDWSCSSWEECHRVGRVNLITRLCSDSNSCGTELDRPIDAESCIIETPEDIIIETPEDNYTVEIPEEPSNITVYTRGNTGTIHSYRTQVNLNDEVEEIMSLSSSNGQINFAENVVIDGNFDLQGNILIEQGTIFINSEEIPELNSPAELTLYNINAENPQILRNGQACSEDQCEILAYYDSTLTFTVNSFSEYTIQETPICGNSICEVGEDCNLCKTDCKTCDEKPVANNSNKKTFKDFEAIQLIFILVLSIGFILILIKVKDVILRKRYFRK